MVATRLRFLPIGFRVHIIELFFYIGTTDCVLALVGFEKVASSISNCKLLAFRTSRVFLNVPIKRDGRVGGGRAACIHVMLCIVQDLLLTLLAGEEIPIPAVVEPDGRANPSQAP